jgi:hypothetical protein
MPAAAFILCRSAQLESFPQPMERLVQFAEAQIPLRWFGIASALDHCSTQTCPMMHQKN